MENLHHIHSSLFYTWRRKLREQQLFAGGFLELIPGRPDDAASGVRIRLGGKLAIEVERGFDPFTLRAVVETLSEQRVFFQNREAESIQPILSRLASRLLDVLRQDGSR